MVAEEARGGGGERTRGRGGEEARRMGALGPPWPNEQQQRLPPRSPPTCEQ